MESNSEKKLSPYQKQQIVEKIKTAIAAIEFLPGKTRLINGLGLDAVTFKNTLQMKVISIAELILDLREKDPDWSIMTIHEISLPLDDLIEQEIRYMVATCIDILERELGLHLTFSFENAFTSSIRTLLTLNGALTTTVHQFEIHISSK